MTPAAAKFFLTVLTALTICASAAPIERLRAMPAYLWPGAEDYNAGTIAERIAPPAGFERVPAAPGSFANWLRNLPLRPENTPVRLYDGRLRWSQDQHVAVIGIDTGDRDLQQCADAIMRLRAEYLLASGQAGRIAFNYTNGKRVRYRGSASDRKAFRRYMTGVFAYAGTYSLEREMAKASLADIRIGDVFINGGFPGHAVLVADMAENARTGEKRFLLVQSYMPAQDMHVLKDMSGREQSPWFSVPTPNEPFITPDWIFKANSLRRFRD